MRRRTEIRKMVTAALMMVAGLPVHAEGIVDIKPYVGTSLTYDDNVFRFSNTDQAEAAFGSSKISDIITRAEVGVNVDLRLSRQLISLTSNIKKNRYNHFKQLDNTGESFGIEWDWSYGSKLFGAIGATRSKALTSFDDLRVASGNIRNATRSYASINWQLHPNWLASLKGSTSNTKNSNVNFFGINAENNVVQAGIQYLSPKLTQVSISYRQIDTDFEDRTNLGSLILFGDKLRKKEVLLSGAWRPTPKLAFSSKLTHFKLNYNNADFNVLPQRSVDGVNKRVNISYAASAKTTLSISAFSELYELQDTLSTYVDVTGLTFNPSWRASEKVNITGNFQIDKRDFLGSTVFGSRDRIDRSRNASVNVIYLPTTKTFVQLSYSKGKRTSNNDFFEFQYNLLSLNFRYNL